jgi:uncharacterized protein YkwD
MFLSHGVEMTSTAGKGKRIGVAAAVVAALAALGFALLVSPPGLDASAGRIGCGPHVDDTPSQAKSRQLRKALACLINRERVQRERKRVRANADLTRIARRHTKAMIKEECFKHECPGERSLRRRIEASGYLKRGGRYGYGEILGCATTPAAMIDTWMNIPFSKKNIVDGRFRHVGVGGKQGSPFPPGGSDCRPGADYMTYAVIFGWRKPKR